MRKQGWWVAHFAEVLGGAAGFAAGFLLLAVVLELVPGVELGWLPLVTALAGALGLRALVKRQPRR